MGCDTMEESVGWAGQFFVSIRIRPLNESEVAMNEDVVWECSDDKSIIYKNECIAPDGSTYPSSYSFDKVFGPNCSTRQVYQEAAKAIALSVVGGENANVLAYGQTNSGKTYTITGITECAMADIFDHIHQHTEREFLLKFSAMEIYNESVRDLLSMTAAPLRLLDDPERGAVVDKLTEEVVQDRNHLAKLLSVCKAQRKIAETLLNESSSRSHQIIKLTVESYARDVSHNDRLNTLFATVNFIDLGGSEHASQPLSSDFRLKEALYINRSLLNLKAINRKLSKGRNGLVPYRDSKLTRILQSCLGGNSRNAIICTVIPARSNTEQSRNTLLFASSAKQGSTSSAKHPQTRLENELTNAESSFGAYSLTLEKEKEKELLIHKLERQVMELMLQRDLALSRIKDVQIVVQEKNLTGQVINEPGNLPYPKLHVRRQSWPSQTSQGSSAADLHSAYSDSAPPKTSYCFCHCCGEHSSSSDSEDDVKPRIPTEAAPFEFSYDESPRLFIRSLVGQEEEEFGIKVRNIEFAELIINDAEPSQISLEEKRPLKGEEKTRMQASSWDQNEIVNGGENSGSLPSLGPEVEKVEVQLNQNKYSLGDDPVNKMLSGKSMTSEATEVRCTKQNAVVLYNNASPKAKGDSSIKKMKHLGVQYDLISQQRSSDFDRLRGVVLNLWDACNVSLLYRTSFFLLFAGDPEDAIYMEVERRRLSFVKDAFAWGNETVLDGQIISPSLSNKHMQQERQMLSKMMKSRISKDEREILYIKWGIHLDTKKRRSQLIGNIWSKPKDMDHVEESAAVVSMLIRFDKSRVRKEMFGINLMPALKGLASHTWLHSASLRF